MKHNRLVNLLKTLEKRELKQLSLFVRSPFHNSNTKVIELMAILKPMYPRFPAEKTSREALHAQLFKGKSFNDMDIRRTMGQLTNTVEQFLGWNEMNRRPAQLKVAQLRAFRERGLSIHFAKCSNDTEQLMDQVDQSIDKQYLEYRIALERELFEDQQVSRRSETRLQEVSDLLDRFYMSSKLKQSCTAFSYEQVFKHKYQINLLDEVLDLLNSEGTDSALVDLYRYGLLTMTDPENPGHFSHLKEILHNELDLETTEERNLHVLGQNFCIRAVNSGKSEYFNELFGLYKLGLEKQVIQSDLSQFPPAFKNIVSTGLRVKQFDWVETFIEQYSELIPEVDRTDFRNYNLARLRFDQGRFSEVKSLLQDVEFHDVFITLNARVLLIKTYYEEDDLGLAEAQVKSFRNYISRQKNLSYHGDIFKSNVRFISKLVRVNLNDPTATSRLRSAVSEQPQLTEKTWILAKLDQRKA